MIEESVMSSREAFASERDTVAAQVRERTEHLRHGFARRMTLNSELAVRGIGGARGASRKRTSFLE